jgi:fluoride exporter
MGLAYNRRRRLMAPTTKGDTMPVVLAVALGGAFGTSARYGLDYLIEQRTFSVFPWSTFAINLSGCFAVGLVIAALVDRHDLPGWARGALVVGFLGGYTTFSTFAQETLDLLEGGKALIGLGYAFASVTLGICAVLLGTAMGRAV